MVCNSLGFIYVVISMPPITLLLVEIGIKYTPTYSEGIVKTAELYDLINDPSETTDIFAMYIHRYPPLP